MIFNLKQYLKDKQSLINTSLKQTWLTHDQIQPDVLFEAMNYSLSAPGKRIRPVLIFACAEVLDMPVNDVMPMAAALEMIHVFSLIHDDLPAMDDDDLRRGQPTNHKVYGEAVAILAGDALLSHAFSVLTKLDQSKYKSENIITVINTFAQATGMPGMITGQVLDIKSENKKISLEELKNLHAHKTGALIRLACTTPAILKGADENTVKQFEDYGKAIGLAFQIVDDILDIVGGEDLGKPIGSDQEKNKSTYPSLLGLDGAKKEAQNALNQALDALSGFGEEAEPLRALARYIVERSH
jgi:geranylgeranyl diphosphate synthase, type II